MPLPTIRILLLIAAAGFWIDGFLHQYTFPNRLLQPRAASRMMDVIFTPSPSPSGNGNN
jgi:hypothetical protein